MKIYEIINSENDKSIGVLLYYEKKKDYIIELQKNLDEWSAPLLFMNLVKKKIYTVPRDISYLWVQERVIPSGRQNISDILKNHKLEAYDEMRLLELSKGICSQDSLYIKKAEQLPEYVQLRRKKNVEECMICEGSSILCIFADGTVKKIDLRNLEHVEGVSKVLKNKKLFQSCKVGTGGYSVTFNDSIDIPATMLCKSGKTIPLSRNELMLFAKNNFVDTSECCEMLECSRQNISYLIRQEQLCPVKTDIKGNLFSKGDVVKNTW